VTKRKGRWKRKGDRFWEGGKKKLVEEEIEGEWEVRTLFNFGTIAINN
jgi:hypothetical protein